MVVKLVVDNMEGTAELQWLDGIVGHWRAFITVPYQSPKWVYLFAYNKDDIEEAKAKAEECLQIELSRCTLM